ncbi:hypothetical protein JXA31_09430 [Candidatus Bathyarchaeota archaeon]|nr:hypothetical protein [Candidatus Bathyarchaeota archaeon]
MNWKNVFSLMQVERKSSRLIRGRKLTRYRENRFLAYWPYWVALGIGLASGVLAGVIYNFATTAAPDLVNLFQEGALSLFFALPTLVLVYSLVFTMMQQIRLSGIKTSTQVPYWLPVTWQEHTMASILASLMGFPLASVVLITSIITVFSLFIGQFFIAALTSLAVFAAAFMASAATEILRVLQVRFIGAVYKSSGRAAVWVRFIGSLMFFLIFYIIYFYVTSGGALTIIDTIATAQTAAWFVPFVWLGIALYSFTTSGLLLQGLIFMGLSLLFIFGLFFLATSLNRRFGLYEPPAITISRGTYAPRTGFLGKLGFSTVEAALIRKDLKAFTRRRELMTIFIVPIVVILVPLMQSMPSTQSVPSSASVLMLVTPFLFPAVIMAMSLGSFMIGEEGQVVWRIYASPISAKALVKSKYFFIVFFSSIVLAITGVFGFVVYNPSLRATIVAYCEAVFLVIAIAAISLSNGIKGADFTEVPRARMIRLSWSLINLVFCLIAGIAILVPFLPYVLSSVMSEFLPSLAGIGVLDPFLALVVSAVIAVVLTVVFYRIAVKNARELLTKAEM